MIRHAILVLFILFLCGVVLFFYRTQFAHAPEERGEFGGVSLRIEYALTPAERQKGLGGRASLEEDSAMLFAFPYPDYHGFWMKDTLIPLDIFWLDDKGHVVFMAVRVATSTFPHVFYPTAPARYVLETVAGFKDKYAIATGTALLLKTFPRVSK